MGDYDVEKGILRNYHANELVMLGSTVKSKTPDLSLFSRAEEQLPWPRGGTRGFCIQQLWQQGKDDVIPVLPEVKSKVGTVDLSVNWRWRLLIASALFQ